MPKTYVCRECKYEFPRELSGLIDNNVQVFCERCGSPFNLEGVKFKPAPTPITRKFNRTLGLSVKDSSNLDKLIQFLNKISYLPLFFFTVISFGLIAEIAFNLDSWGFILFNRLLQGLIGLSLLIYDGAYIAPKIKEKKYNEIFLDSLCWGILGCVLYGLGVLVLIKGVFIIIYILVNHENQKDKNLKAYDYGLLAKNSINYFSSKAGFVIILMGIFRAYDEGVYLPAAGSIPIPITFPGYFELPIVLLVYAIFLIISLVALSIDKRSKSLIEIKQKFDLSDSIRVVIIGVIGSLFYAAGIFILLKGVLLFFLFLSKSSEKPQFTPSEQKTEYTPQAYKLIEQTLKTGGEEKEKLIDESPMRPPPTVTTPKEKDLTPIEEKTLGEKLEKIESLEEILEKREEEKNGKKIDLRLHESLLPVKDEKDKKLVKEYFSKIFAVLSKDLREQIKNLKISKKEKRELLEELAFLTKEEQIKYIEVLVDLYKEIPKKLIERIKKLSNVSTKHIDKIVEQLRQMDVEEQLKFVQFLEENA